MLRHMWLNHRSQPDFVVVNDARANPRSVARWHDRGLPVWVYTVNDPDEMAELFGRGVDGVFTDRVDLGLERFGAL